MKLFDSILVHKPKRNKFDLSHERKLTLNMGFLYPILNVDTLPGDKFRIKSDVFLRFQALIAPVVHRVDVSVHYFKVPYRLLWINWASAAGFITGGEQGNQQQGAGPSMPTFSIQNVNTAGAQALKESSLLDYLGFPVMKASDTLNANYNAQQFNALHLRAYQLIYDQFYRDQWVEPTNLSATFASDGLMSVADTSVMVSLRQRMWQKDYYTAALPNTQRGSLVTIPITGTVTVPTTGIAGAPVFRVNATGNVAVPTSSSNIQNISGSGHVLATNLAVQNESYYDPAGSMSVTSSSLTVNALRQSLRLQEFFERMARGGGRYIEAIAAHFGVISSDARLQRVEYLGGGKAPVVVSEVLQTAPAAGASTPLAYMGGHALAVGNTNQVHTYCEEHCVLMGIMSVIPKAAYQQSMTLNPWRKYQNTDYYWPSFAHLGEQSVLNFEVYTNLADGGAFANMFNVFGYQSRYAEYKYIPDMVHGAFRSTLNYWHFGRVFAAQPSLNLAFLQCTPPTTSFAVQGLSDNLIAQIFHRIDALRPIPYFSAPTL